VTDEGPAPTATVSAAGLRRAALALLGLGLVGLPATWGLAQLAGGRDAAVPTAAGAWVWLVALLGLLPLWLTRGAAPATQVNALLGHVVLRLLLTAGGLILLLLVLPKDRRFGVGLTGLIWYILTWIIDAFCLFVSPRRPVHKGAET
jgi:hypothetical protein